jgi:hypothetical protein
MNYIQAVGQPSKVIKDQVLQKDQNFVKLGTAPWAFQPVLSVDNLGVCM